MKAELLEKLLHESECTYLDFKQAQYPFVGATDDVKSELLKDILALANADKPGDGYILIGVEEARGSRGKILGITTHLNDHDLQQFVASKTNRPVGFSYEVAPCDGCSIGVLHVPAQSRPIFLKNDYGKLRRNVAYYRLGSSTREATPEELIRWGQDSAAKDSEPLLELQFAHIKRTTVIGGSKITKEAGTSISVQSRNSSSVRPEQIAELIHAPHQFGYTQEQEYWKEFAEFVRFGLLFAPVGLALKNVGGTTATGVQVKIEPKSQLDCSILGEDWPSRRPLHRRKISGGGMMPSPLIASHTRTNQKDIIVHEENGAAKIMWSIPKALPHLSVFSEGLFFVGKRERGQIELECSIFAENLRRPIHLTMTVNVEKLWQDLTTAEIQKFSEDFTMEDIKDGTGHVM